MVDELGARDELETPGLHPVVPGDEIADGSPLTAPVGGPPSPVPPSWSPVEAGSGSRDGPRHRRRRGRGRGEAPRVAPVEVPTDIPYLMVDQLRIGVPRRWRARIVDEVSFHGCRAVARHRR